MRPCRISGSCTEDVVLRRPAAQARHVILVDFEVLADQLPQKLRCLSDRLGTGQLRHLLDRCQGTLGVLGDPRQELLTGRFERHSQSGFWRGRA